MFNPRKSLAYLAVLAALSALSLASCSDSGSQTAAPQAAQHRFNVYFDIAKSDLTPEAQQVIAQAVAEASRNANAKILVAAPETDANGRRTTAVQTALVAAGVSPDRIDARWIGPQGSPPPGVRDPRNRMVEISFDSDLSGRSETAKVFESKPVGD